MVRHIILKGRHCKHMNKILPVIRPMTYDSRAGKRMLTYATPHLTKLQNFNFFACSSETMLLRCHHIQPWRARIDKTNMIYTNVLPLALKILTQRMNENKRFLKLNKRTRESNLCVGYDLRASVAPIDFSNISMRSCRLRSVFTSLS